MKRFIIALGFIFCSIFGVQAQPGNTTCKVSGQSNMSVTVSPPTATAMTLVDSYGIESTCVECKLTLSKKSTY